MSMLECYRRRLTGPARSLTSRCGILHRHRSQLFRSPLYTCELASSTQLLPQKQIEPPHNPRAEPKPIQAAMPKRHVYTSHRLLFLLLPYSTLILPRPFIDAVHSRSHDHVPSPPRATTDLTPLPQRDSLLASPASLSSIPAASPSTTAPPLVSHSPSFQVETSHRTIPPTGNSPAFLQKSLFPSPEPLSGPSVIES